MTVMRSQDEAPFKGAFLFCYTKSMNKAYEESTVFDGNLETYFESFILPEFGIDAGVAWMKHVRIGPDSFLHIFSVDKAKYALVFDDYYSGESKVDRDESIERVKLANGEAVLQVTGVSGRYIENVTGAFRLFMVKDEQTFSTFVNYLESSFETLQKQWREESRDIVVIARDVLQIAETASQNHDVGMLYSIQNIIDSLVSLDVDDNSVSIELLQTYVKILIDAEFGREFYEASDKNRVSKEIYSLLAKDVQRTLNVQKYKATNLGKTVKHVSAMYARVKGNNTEGVTIALTCDDEGIHYPVSHFLNKELEKYFNENQYIGRNNIEYHLPDMLKDYRLVEGSIFAQDVFPQELEHISY